MEYTDNNEERPRYKYLRDPTWEELKSTLEYNENGRLKVESFYNSSAHKEYAGNIGVVLPDYERIVIIEEALNKGLKSSKYFQTEKGKEDKKKFLNEITEFYLHHPELEKLRNDEYFFHLHQELTHTHRTS